MGVDLVAMKPGLQRLRQGQGLAQPQVVLGSSPALRRCLLGSAAEGDSSARVALAVVASLADSGPLLALGRARPDEPFEVLADNSRWYLS
jgi:hypothetical protein